MTQTLLAVPVSIGAVVQALSPYLEYLTGPVNLEDHVTSLVDGSRPAQAAGGLLIERAETRDRAGLDDLDAYCQAAGVRLLVLRDPDRTVLQRPPRPDGTVPTTLVVGEGVSWATVTGRLQLVCEESARAAEPVTGQVLTDLAEAADLLAEALGGSVIVEDNNFQMLAHSRADDELDEARRVAILQRRLPDLYQRAFNAQGIIATMVGGTDLVQASPVPEIGLGPRLVAAIRHEADLLGSVWLARDGTHFDDADRRTLLAAATEFGPLLRQILQARRDQREYLNTSILALLRGHRPDVAADIVRRTVGLAAEPALHVLYFTAPAAVGDDTLLAAVRSAADAVAGSLRARVFTVLEGGVVKVVLLGCPHDAAQCTDTHPTRFARRVLDELPDAGQHLGVGIGGHRAALHAAWESAAEAGLAARAVQERGTGAIAALREVWAEVAVWQCLELVAEPLQKWHEPLDRVLQWDTDRGTDYARTLEVALDHWGDVRTAADQLHIHPNTLRYRLSRMAQVAGIDLDAPAQRLVLRLQLLRRRRHPAE